MVLISIHPFALRKIFLIAVTLLCLSAFCFADSLLMARRYGPGLGRVSVEQAMSQLPEQITAGNGPDHWVEIAAGEIVSDPAELRLLEQGVDASSRASLSSKPSCVYHVGF